MNEFLIKNMPKKLHQKLWLMKIEQGKDINDIIKDAIEAHIKQYEKKKPLGRMKDDSSLKTNRERPTKR